MRFFKATKARAASERLDQNFNSDCELCGRSTELLDSAFKLQVVQVVAEWLLLLLSWMYEHAGDTDVQPCADFQKGIRMNRIP